MEIGKALLAVGDDFATASFVLDNRLQWELSSALF
jgi:hypothetical protein